MAVWQMLVNCKIKNFVIYIWNLTNNYTILILIKWNMLLTLKPDHKKHVLLLTEYTPQGM